MRFILMDRYGKDVGDLPAVVQATRTRGTDGTDTLDLVTVGEVEKDQRIVFRDGMGRWTEYLCTSADTDRSSGIPMTTAYCTNSMAELSRTFIVDKSNRNATPADCLGQTLEGTRWRVGEVQTGTLTGRSDLSFYHCSVLDAIDKICDAFGLEVETSIGLDPGSNVVATRTINLLEGRGNPGGARRFEYGRDLTEIKRRVDSSDVVTRLYGWGKGVDQSAGEEGDEGGHSRKISFADINDGRPYVQDDDALADWGLPGPEGELIHAEGSVDFPDCDDPNELLTLTRRELEVRSRPKVSYEATVANLGNAGMSVDGLDLGDGVQIIDTTFPRPLRLSGRVLKIEEELLGPAGDTRLTLGNISRSYTRRLAAQEQSVDRLIRSAGAWDEAASTSHAYIDDIISRVNQIMNEAGGYIYLVPGEGLYVYDRPRENNPEQVIQVGEGHWRTADRKKANGDWDWRPLADGHGIYADSISAGTIRGGGNKWDLDTGRLDFRQGSIDIDGPAGTRVSINAASGLSITQHGQLIGGMEVVDGVAHVRAQRVGSSPDLYLTTGKTGQGNPGASMSEGGQNYLDLEAVHDSADPGGEADGVGLSTFNRPFLSAGRHGTPYLWIQPPTKEGDYSKPDSTHLSLSQDTSINLETEGVIQLNASHLAVGTEPGQAGTYGFTGEIPLISKVEDAENGGLRWRSGTINVVNGIITDASAG